MVVFIIMKPYIFLERELVVFIRIKQDIFLEIVGGFF